jgi:hypothetical protein
VAADLTPAASGGRAPVPHPQSTTFGMRFVLNIALTDPGVDLGEPPEPRFDPEPTQLDAERALAAFR